MSVRKKQSSRPPAQTKGSDLARHAASVWTSLLEVPLLEPAGTATKTMKLTAYRTLRTGFRLYETMTAADQKAGLLRASKSKKVSIAKVRSLLAAECGIVDDRTFQRMASTLPPRIKAELGSLRAMSKSGRAQRLEALKNDEVLELLLHLTRLLANEKPKNIGLGRAVRVALFGSVALLVLLVTKLGTVGNVTSTLKQSRPQKPAGPQRATEKPAERATQKPAELTTEKPAELTTEKPAELTTQKPAERAKEKPAERAKEKPAKLTKKQGDTMFNAKNYDGAIECYTKAFGQCEHKRSNLAKDIVNNRSACYQHKKNFHDMVRDAGFVLDIEPTNQKALIRRGLGYEALGRFELALQDMQQVLHLSTPPDDKFVGIATAAQSRISSALREEEEMKTDGS